MVTHELSPFFEGPAERVHARVHDQSGRREQLHGVGAVLADRVVFQKARVDAEEGRVHAPPLGVRRVHPVPTEVREVLVRVLSSDVEVVPWEQLVEGQALVGEPAPLIEIRAVEVVVPDRVGGARWVVVPVGLGRLEGGIESPGPERGVRLGQEEPVGLGEELVRGRLDALLHLVDRLGEVVWVRGDVSSEVVDRAFESDPVLELQHPCLQGGDGLQPDLVDLFGRYVHRRVSSDEVSVGFGAAWVLMDPHVCGGGRPVFSVEEAGQAGQRGIDARLDDLGHLGTKRFDFLEACEPCVRHVEWAPLGRDDVRAHDPHHGVHVGLRDDDAPLHLLASVTLDECNDFRDLPEHRHEAGSLLIGADWQNGEEGPESTYRGRVR